MFNARQPALADVFSFAADPAERTAAKRTIGFAVCLAVLLAVGIGSAAAGYTFGWMDGHSAGFDQCQAFYRDFVPRGEPLVIPPGFKIKEGKE